MSTELVQSRGELDVPRLLSGLVPVFEATGTDVTALDSLDQAVAATQPWVRGDHGYKGYAFNLDVQGRGTLNDAYHYFDMVGQRDLSTGHYDDLLVFGAIHLGNRKRLAYTRQMLNSGVTAEHVTLLGGERALFPEREPDDVALSIRNIEQNGGGGSWFAGVKERFMRAMQTGDHSLISETDMVRLATLEHLGPLAVTSMGLHLGLEDQAVTSTPITNYEFDYKGTPVSLLHSRAHPRKDGDPRHTTISCTDDWLERFNPRHGARIAMVGSQPHLDRMRLTVARALREAGRDDIELVAGGPGTTQDTGHSIYLGEIGRYLYELQLLVNVRGVNTRNASMEREAAVPGLGALATLEHSE